MIYLDEELRDLLNEASMFDQLAAMPGQVFRQVASRRTFRFEHRGKAYFAKVHHGVGWHEIFKNLLQLRLPILGAANEWYAIRRLEQAGLDTLTPVAYCRSGDNPARQESCIVTRALVNTISLEDLVLAGPRPFAEKRRLIRKVASMCARMHRAGVNHRDLYICHFHLDQATRSCRDPRIYIIDLHRAQLRRRTPRRWVVKDIGGLLFSALDAGLTRTDLFRFMRDYAGKSLRATMSEDRQFWVQVHRRAKRLYRQEFGHDHVDGWHW